MNAEPINAGYDQTAPQGFSMWVYAIAGIGIIFLIGLYGQAMYQTGFQDGLDNNYHLEHEAQKELSRTTNLRG